MCHCLFISVKSHHQKPTERAENILIFLIGAETLLRQLKDRLGTLRTWLHDCEKLSCLYEALLGTTPLTDTPR